MKTNLAAVALAAALAQPASAITFPNLTTIYVGAGVVDWDSVTPPEALGTAFNCSNVSGATATVRFLVLAADGAVKGNATRSVGHGSTVAVVTRPNSTFFWDVDLATGRLQPQGVVNIESTQSGVFCNAVIINLGDAGEGITLPLVRVNPHPGTVE